MAKELGKKLIKRQLDEIKSAARKARNMPIATQEELVIEISEKEEKITQLETDNAVLIIERAGKSSVNKDLTDEIERLQALNKRQDDKLLWTVAQNAGLIEAHKQALRYLRRTIGRSIKSYIWEDSKLVQELQVKVAHAEGKSKQLETRVENTNQELKQMKANLQEEKVRGDELEAWADQEITQAKQRQ